MELNQFIDDEDRPVRTVATADGREIVADLGAETDDAVVDLVEDTAIVIAGEEQFDVDLPSAPERAFIKNGVLTIEMEDDA